MTASDAVDVVIVEDDDAVADLLTTALRRAGHRPFVATDGEGGLAAIRAHRPSIAVVDVNLPGAIDGFDVCRQVRAEGDTPLLLLTARTDEIDRVLGLELGADDYVTKPFSPRELVARIKAILRRSAAGAQAPGPAVVALGRVEVDRRRGEVRLDGVPVDLAPREWALLTALAGNQGMLLTRRQLLDAGWGPGWIGDERTVDVHVRQLRRKLGDALPLRTVRGSGYRLD